MIIAVDLGRKTNKQIYQLTKFESTDCNTSFDILITSFQCQNWQRAITKMKYFYVAVFLGYSQYCPGGFMAFVGFFMSRNSQRLNWQWFWF